MKDKMLTDQELIHFFFFFSKSITPDSSVQERLNYTFMVKSSAYKTAQNSFTGMFSWLFSWSNVPVKAALVSIVLFLSIVNFQSNESQFIAPGCDTTINTIPLKVDSVGMLPFYADSCLNTKS